MTFTGLVKTLFLLLVLSSFQRSNGSIIPSHLGTPVEASESLVPTIDHHPGNSVAPMGTATRPRADGRPASNQDRALRSFGQTKLSALAEPYFPLALQAKRSSNPPPIYMYSIGSASTWETSRKVREATAYNNDVHTNLPASTEDLFKGLYTTPNYHLQHIDHRVAPAETKGTEGSF